jgi:putative phosphoesterase
MIKVGLLSDTHGHIDDLMFKFLEPVDEIWHAGDIGDIDIFDGLIEDKRFRAVYGNIDDYKIRQEFPDILIFNVEEVKVVMTHIGGYPKRYAPGIRDILKEEKPNIFISGHSHILKVVYDKQLDLLHINPGASGINGFHQVRTMVRFEIDGNDIRNLEVWEYKR